MTEIERLQKTVLDVHGYDGIHIRTVHVDEVFEGRPLWAGDVEEFLIIDHPSAVRAYAWSYKDEASETKSVAVLGVPPIQTPVDAVRAYVALQFEKDR